MSISELTHATVAQCDVAAAESEATYRAELAALRFNVLRPVMAQLKRCNAIARKCHMDRLKKIKAYRAVLSAEQPTEEQWPNEEEGESISQQLRGGPTDDD